MIYLLLGIFVVIVILAIIIGIVAIKNNIIRFGEDVKNSESRIDVYLTKRFDCLTKMVQTVKSYTKHEVETLKQVIAMRNPGRDASISEKAEFEAEMTRATKELNILVEQYPTLKADTLFVRLQDEISTIEEDLQAARSNYNANVSHFNKYIRVFPNSLFAGNAKPYDYFEAEDNKRQDVVIDI